MFRKNTQHQQPALISAVRELPEKHRQRLEQSWAGVFYRECFCRIDEEAFAVLYSEVGSRPNVPVNVLIGLEAIKAGFGWSDQELYECAAEPALPSDKNQGRTGNSQPNRAPRSLRRDSFLLPSGASPRVGYTLTSPTPRQSAAENRLFALDSQMKSENAFWFKDHGAV